MGTSGPDKLLLHGHEPSEEDGYAGEPSSHLRTQSEDGRWTPATPHATLPRTYTLLCNSRTLAPTRPLLWVPCAPQLFAMTSLGGFLLCPILWVLRVPRVSVSAANAWGWGFLCHILLWGPRIGNTDIGLCVR